MVANNSSARGRIPCLFPISVLGFGLTWACIGPVQGVVTAMSLYVQLSYCVQKTLFPDRRLLNLTLTLSLFTFLPKSVRLGTKGCGIYIPFGF